MSVPPAVQPREVDPPKSAADKDWEQGAARLERRSAEQARVEQSVYYAGCREARAAGKAPIYAGQPGYRSGLDGDGDGIACEPYRG